MSDFLAWLLRPLTFQHTPEPPRPMARPGRGRLPEPPRPWLDPVGLPLRTASDVAASAAAPLCKMASPGGCRARASVRRGARARLPGRRCARAWLGAPGHG